MSGVRLVLASFRLQLAISRRSPGQLMILLVAPLFSAIFLSLVVNAENPAAIVNAVLAPGLIGLWLISLDLAGSILDEDRWNGRMELLIGTPAPLSLVVFGRILVIVLAGTLTFAESWLLAVLGFGVAVPFENPGLFVLALLVTCFAMAGTATLLAAAFVLSRAMYVFQNAMSYPFYILGGILVPVAALPGWLEPISRVVFLSWSADLLRDAMRLAAVPAWPLRLVAVAGLGALAFAAGIRLIHWVVDRNRRTATVGAS